MKRDIFKVLGFSFCIFIIHINNLSCEEKYETKLDEILQYIEDASERLKTMTADIQYTRNISLLDSVETSHGTLKYKKPKKMKIHFLPPRNEVNVFDGAHMWIYHPEEQQVEKYKIDDGINAPQEVDLFELGYEYSADKIRKKYDITIIDDLTNLAGTIYHLELIPKETTESQYSRILLWIKETEWLPSQFQLFESDGEIVNTIALSNININGEISDNIFRLDLPDSVEIIEPFK
ncbi:MAG: outer membrane lipoprotein carrier protein LolA [Candidatus Scalindua sp. AMX11]|nr:MAG: outer membrane lipoprotein carrier protein LolA [Candidatus Scalindua sp.]NOG82738.1 outer membrane lipoprotein carrier protein LolA [Planctomycetota bacterium]RZV95307.1 MAG: outer membrane lipoprotein carrier protein LolA [Candidatus Scalindua sp. SCAELEC01]TDE66210.1 MAG: outer membrane lipoprotein carrier protein LolA [Candidatus Scalindua sp. AMX11]GJQ57831.1 MAG: hypothetical protein SCALA701_06320 [Candidatus Scalindua sp.]